MLYYNLVSELDLVRDWLLHPSSTKGRQPVPIGEDVVILTCMAVLTYGLKRSALD